MKKTKISLATYFLIFGILICIASFVIGITILCSLSNHNMYLAMQNIPFLQFWIAVLFFVFGWILGAVINIIIYH